MAAHLGVAPKNLRLAALAGIVPSIAVGDGLLFVPEAVEQALLKCSRCRIARDEQSDAKEAPDVG